MPTLDVYDPAMCCATGICGPEVDPALTRFAADLDWLKSQGVTVNRYNLAQEPSAFAEQPVIKKLLEETDGEGLPALLIDGKLAHRGGYPDRESLSASLGLGGEDESDSAEALPLHIRHLLALTASVAANNQEAFRHHQAELRRLGVEQEHMLAAADIALQIKQLTDASMLQLAEEDLVPQGESGCCGGGGCCG